MSEVLSTTRLRLSPLSPAAFVALEAGDASVAESELGLSLPAEWVAGLPWAPWAARVARDPSEVEWLVRIVSMIDEPEVVANAGFYRSPVAGAVEIGYAVVPSRRGLGIATETVSALVEWAFARGVRSVRARISPDNLASLKVAAHVGFIKTGHELDSEEGELDVFERLAL